MAAEQEARARALGELRTQILARHPKLEVELLLMSLNGEVETL